MPHYVYKIWSRMGDKVYYGSTSTKRNPKQRYHQHVAEYKRGYLRCSSKQLFDEYGVENCLFDVIENVEDPSQVRRRERFYIENNDCVNKCRPNPTDDEKKQIKNEYTKNHKKEKKDYDASYRMKDEERYIKIECYCGGSYVSRHRSTHEKTKKHIEYQ